MVSPGRRIRWGRPPGQELPEEPKAAGKIKKLLDAIGQAQAAQPPIQVEPPKSATPTPPTEEATAKPPAAETATANIPVRVDTPVRVRANSWVELRSPTGDVLAQTYVRAGESYTVPAGIAYRIIDAR